MLKSIIIRVEGDNVRLYYQYDLDQNGYIDAEELRHFNPDYSEDDITKRFEEYDANRDGLLSKDEFISIKVENK